MSLLRIAHECRAAGGDGFERARRRIGLPVVVVAPAGDGVVAADRARMRAAGGDGFERARRRIGLPGALLLPQQVMVSLLRIAHECQLPAVTVLNVPDGKSACPERLPPQQVMVSLLRIAHECELPAVTVLNVPDGATVRQRSLL